MLPAHGWSNLQLKGSVPITSQWPARVEGGLCWEPTECGDEYTLSMTDDEVVEVRTAVAFFNGSSYLVTSRALWTLTSLGLGLYGSDVSPSTFPLPTLGTRLLDLALAVHIGSGFAVVRGLNPDDFSQEDNVVIFLGISSYIGSKRGRQDEEGNMLSELATRLTTVSLPNSLKVHIRDAKFSRARQEDRPIRYSARASVSCSANSLFLGWEWLTMG